MATPRHLIWRQRCIRRPFWRPHTRVSRCRILLDIRCGCAHQRSLASRMPNGLRRSRSRTRALERITAIKASTGSAESETANPPVCRSATMPARSPAHSPRKVAMTRSHIVIVGAGFGGLSAATHLAGADVDVTVIDRRNYHLFQPLLYQVATAGPSPAPRAPPPPPLPPPAAHVRALFGEVATRAHPRQPPLV